MSSVGDTSSSSAPKGTSIWSATTKTPGASKAPDDLGKDDFMNLLLAQLKQSFSDQGLRVDRFVVEVAQGQFSQDSQHPRRSRGWVDDVRAKQGRGDETFAEELAAAGARPVDYMV